MKAEENKLYGLTTLAAVLSVMDITEEELNNALNEGYQCYKRIKYDKPRLIEAPCDKLKKIQRIINDCLQDFDCPEYVMYAWKGRNALLNAKAHIGQFSFSTMDINHYFPNTKTKYVREFFADVLKIKGEALEYLVKLTTLNGHLPTGAPTSPILAYLSHKKLFDEIYEHMQKKDITYTLLADDITLSAKHGITREEVRYVASVLGRHGLRLKKKKTKFYSYKKALITGFYVLQCGRISVPYKIARTIIGILKEKPIKDMNKYELKRLGGYVNYQRLSDKKSFLTTKMKVKRQLKKLAKIEQQKGI